MSLREELESIIDEEGVYSAIWEASSSLIEDEIQDTTRWSILKRAVIKYKDAFFAIEYDEGATEYQDSSGDYTLYEVVPVEKTVIQYVKKN